MICPPFLKKKSRIAITCPSGYLASEHAELTREILTRWGFQVIMGKTIGHEFHYFSGDDNFRRDELQSFLDDPNIDAVMAGRGGYGLSRIIDQIDFSKFQKNPKWIIGFSDITVLHTHIHTQCGIATIHGPMCHAFMETNPNEPWLETLKSLLLGEAVHYVLTGDENNKEGMAQGALTGGNLAILAHLCGSVSQPDTSGKILFIEEVNEYIYAIDRMLLTLKRSGMLRGLSGLVCGSFTELKDTERPFGSTIPKIVVEKVAEYNYPVCFGFSAGHLRANYPIMLGKEHRLSVTKDLVRMDEV